MAGLVPAIHIFYIVHLRKTWMPGTRPGMTRMDWPFVYYAVLSNSSRPISMRRISLVPAPIS
jgi:hypothetical protein